LVRGGEPASQVEVATRIGARQNDISRAFGWLIDWGYVIDDYQPKKKDHRYFVADRLFVQFYKMRYLQPGERPQLAILTDLLAATIEFRDKWNFAERYHGDGHSAESLIMAELACMDCGIDAKTLPEEMRSAEGLLKLGKDWLRWDELAKDASGPYSNLQQIVTGPNAIRTDEAFRADMDRLQALANLKAKGDAEMQELFLLAKASSAIPTVRYTALAHYVSPSAPSTHLLKMISKHSGEAELVEVFDRSPLGVSLTIRAELALTDRDETSQLPALKDNALDWILLSASLMRKARLVIPNTSHHHMLGRLLGRTKDGVKPPEQGWSNPEAVEAVLSRNHDAPALLRILCLLHLSDAYASNGDRLNQFGTSARAHAAALSATLDHRDKDSSLADSFLSPINIAARQLSTSQEGIEALLHATKLAEQSGDPVPLTVAWAALIREKASIEGMCAAWRVLDAIHPRKTADTLMVISLLVSLQGKRLAVLSPPQAFQEGVAFFRELNVRKWADPMERLVLSLAYFICEGVAPPVILDLMYELPNLFGKEIPNFEVTTLLIVYWLHHLELDPVQRAQELSKLNPDLATMLRELNDNLSQEARKLYGLEQKSVSSA
jgi:hypothetical protein